MIEHGKLDGCVVKISDDGIDKVPVGGRYGLDKDYCIATEFDIFIIETQID